jgi:predicted CXXCH cytochrome family protein
VKLAGATLAVTDFKKKVWVTRPRPGVDRMASAWLIRRAIDPNAAFVFRTKPRGSEIPFDMYTGDFGHHGELCTFETLAARFSLRDAAVTSIGQIVHDLDMKENDPPGLCADRVDRQSLMYARGVTCASCHDPHGTPNNADLVRSARLVCLTCRGPASPNGPHAAAIEQHTHHQPGSAGSDCVSCHVPNIAVMLGDVKVRSHTFKFIAPAMAERLKMPDPCTTCHTDKT